MAAIRWQRIERRTITVLVALANADEELKKQENDAGQDEQGTDKRNVQVGFPGWVVMLIQATGHAHETKHVQRHERQEEADKPAPEGVLAQALIELESEY